jgi:hypothetical protein
MTHKLSESDLAFREKFESFAVDPSKFDHRAHLRLAYIYLASSDTEAAYQLMRRSLQAFLDHLGVGASKYHDTMTRAWILAVRHFMEATPDCDSAEAFIDANPIMLDTKIIQTHYSAGLLFSDGARAGFVEPDLDPIPRYDESTT